MLYTIRMAKEKTAHEKFSNVFLIIILAGILFLCYLLLRPFLIEIVLSAVLVTIFYPLYLKLVYWTRGRISLSATIICVGILLVVLVPFSYFILYLAQKLLAAYAGLSAIPSSEVVRFIDTYITQNLRFINQNVFDVRQFITSALSTIQSVLLPAASSVIKGTTGFVISLVLILITMFFMFRDGRSALVRLMRLTPLSNKYDKLIWMKFRDVSYSAIVSTFVIAIIQGLTGGLAFFIVGIPPFIPIVLMIIASILPYIGASLIWGPVGIYLILTGSLWQGIFLLVWGLLVVSMADNILRPIMIKGKAKVHPMIVFFSIIGGIPLFGFWGIVFGPLIVALTVTILHIYELEYANLLDGKEL